MSNKKSFASTGGHSGNKADVSAKSDTARISNEISSMYSDEMSKKAVGGLFGDNANAERELRKDDDGAPVEGLEDKEYMEYISSYSKPAQKLPKSDESAGEKKRNPVNKPASRNVSVSLSSKSDSKTIASLRRGSAFEDNFDDDDFTDVGPRKGSKLIDGPFAEVLSQNMRYIGVFGVVVMLAIMVALIFRINSLDHQLKTANVKIEEFSTINDEKTRLDMQIDELNTRGREMEKTIQELESENTALRAQLNNDETPDNPSGVGDEGTAANPGQSSPSTATMAPGNTKYTVKDRDTFWSIAESLLGNGTLYPKILEANNLKEDAVLQPGMELIIPPR